MSTATPNGFKCRIFKYQGSCIVAFRSCSLSHSNLKVVVNFTSVVCKQFRGGQELEVSPGEEHNIQALFLGQCLKVVSISGVGSRDSIQRLTCRQLLQWKEHWGIHDGGIIKLRGKLICFWRLGKERPDLRGLCKDDLSRGYPPENTRAGNVGNPT